MANVMFKRGLSTKLPATAQDGVFYLTTDTNRLYVGQGTSMVELNKSITTVANVESLPATNVAKGQFYYAEAENILCEYNGTGWTQINPDTHLVASTQNTSVESVTGGAKVSTSVESKRGAAVAETSAGSFTIKGKGAATVSVNSSNEIEVGVDAGVDYSATLKTKVNDSKAELEFAQAGNTTAANKTQAISITGDGLTHVSSDAAGNITISTPELGVENEISIKNGTITSAVTVGAQSDDASITPTVKYGKATTKTSASIADDASFTLDVYTTNEVDKLVEDKLKAFDAMEYKGTVASSAAVNAAGNVGDTYKAVSGFNLAADKANGGAAVDVRAGDLLVAMGTDGAVKYDVIPSGNDQVITASISSEKGDFVVEDNGTLLGGLLFTNGNKTSVSTKANATNSEIKEIQINHTTQSLTKNTSTASQTKGASTEDKTTDVTMIDSVTTDDYGHLTAINTKTVTLIDSHNRLDQANSGVSVDAANNKAKVSLTVASNDNSVSLGLGVNSTSLTVGKTAASGSDPAAVVIDLTWGTFE